MTLIDEIVKATALGDHFHKFNPRYQTLFANKDKVKDVLLHQVLLSKAKDPKNCPVFHVRVTKMKSDGNDDPKSSTTVPSSYRHEVEDIPKYEISFATLDKPELISELSILLSDMRLSIHEAVEFSTVDGYYLGVFVVDGSPVEDTDGLREAVGDAVSRTKGLTCNFSELTEHPQLGFLTEMSGFMPKFPDHIFDLIFDRMDDESRVRLLFASRRLRSYVLAKVTNVDLRGFSDDLAIYALRYFMIMSVQNRQTLDVCLRRLTVPICDLLKKRPEVIGSLVCEDCSALHSKDVRNFIHVMINTRYVVLKQWEVVEEEPEEIYTLYFRIMEWLRQYPIDNVISIQINSELFSLESFAAEDPDVRMKHVEDFVQGTTLDAKRIYKVIVQFRKGDAVHVYELKVERNAEEYSE